ncbi:MAG: response regulator [Candidatus Paceibacterota bacterium]|jgi:CheY-like chemotaxis protein
MKDKKKILVVEDEAHLRKIIGDFLRGEDELTVFEAEDGAVALEMVKKDMPDLILLDIVMPVMDGVTFAKKMNEEHLAERTKIMFLTNSGDLSIISSVSSPSVVGYFIKSNIDLRDLLKKIKEEIGL